MKKKIRVLIVDDSGIMRKVLEKLLSLSLEIEVVGMAEDAYVARDKLVQLKPDVMMLDIEMPKMDGITFLKKVMAHMPTRTIVCSSLGREGSEMYFKALEAGAVDVVEKPNLEAAQTQDAIAHMMIEKIKLVASAQWKSQAPTAAAPVAAVPTKITFLPPTNNVIFVASSTGGTEALKVFLSGMPPQIPAMLIAQHMPPVFTKSFSQSLDKMFPFEVKEAEEGDEVIQGRVLIAPGNFHMEIKKKGSGFVAHLHQEAPMHNVRPAADYLLRSAAQKLGNKAIGVVLTGMGRDGADGLLEMRKAGAMTYAQDQTSCVVYGMPRVAAEIGAVEKVLPLDKIAPEILRRIQQKAAA